jgi:S1-C subfamily serine protease
VADRVGVAPGPARPANRDGLVAPLDGAIGLAPSVVFSPARDVTTPAGSTRRSELSIPDLVQLVRPSIVHIATESVSRDTAGRMIPAGGVGTGFVIDAEGLIVTNNHVVASAQQIVVTTDAGDVHDATVIGRDPQTDLAVLRVDAGDLNPIPLGRSADLRIGESVVAIGHALDLPGGPTVTVGVVSALDRTITNVGPQRLTLSDLIQTDASINPGNSGGPLLNLYGEVVGVNSAAAGSATGIGFAIAIDGARPVIAQLVETGQVVRGFLGIGPATITRGLARQLELPVSQGIVVVNVTPGGPADLAGLRVGDILVAINDEPVPDAGTLSRVLAHYGPSDDVAVRYIRPGGDDQPQETRVRLGRRPDQLVERRP